MKVVGVLGATSLVGDALLPLLFRADFKVFAFSRKPQPEVQGGLTWRALDEAEPSSDPIPLWICLAPIWALSEHFELLKRCGARRIVALSSTSRFTKVDSRDSEERDTADRLAEGERKLCMWAGENDVEFVILRTTMIYGSVRDNNISAIAGFIRRFGFFPVFGAASGFRQPVHVEDVATACVAAFESHAATDHSYNLSGAEVLSYREMVERVFRTMGKSPRIVPVPIYLIRLALCLFRMFPRCRHWTAGMAERMNRDMVFDHDEATSDFGFSPRSFEPSVCEHLMNKARE